MNTIDVRLLDTFINATRVIPESPPGGHAVAAEHLAQIDAGEPVDWATFAHSQLAGDSLDYVAVAAADAHREARVTRSDEEREADLERLQVAGPFTWELVRSMTTDQLDGLLAVPGRERPEPTEIAPIEPRDPRVARVNNHLLSGSKLKLAQAFMDTTVDALGTRDAMRIAATYRNEARRNAHTHAGDRDAKLAGADELRRRLADDLGNVVAAHLAQSDLAGHEGVDRWVRVGMLWRPTGALIAKHFGQPPA